MNGFFWHIFWAFFWIGITENVSPANICLGLAVSYLGLRWTRPELMSGYRFPRWHAKIFRKIFLFIEFVFFFIWEFVLSNLRVAYYVLTPLSRIKPGVIAVPLDAKTDGEVITLANLITLTPGTISMEVSDDRKYLYVHVIDIKDLNTVKLEIKEGLERRVLKLFR